MPKLLKKKFIFSDDLELEVKLHGTIKMILGFLGLLILSHYIHMYINQPEIRSGRPFIEPYWKDQNNVARFLMWGGDQFLLIATVPFLDSMAMTGILLIIGAQTRVSELLQLWIIISIMFCILDMVLIIPVITYSEIRSIPILLYLLSYTQKFYTFWIVKSLLLEINPTDEGNHGGEFDYNEPTASAAPKKF